MTGVPIDLSQFEISGPIALLILCMMLAVLAVFRGWVVPRSFYDKEVKRGDDLFDALKKNNDTLDALTTEIRVERGGHR
jgi:uncharacterized ion transporter superfamily protein YfcC